YGTRESAVTAVVDENSAINGSPRNVPATRFIGTLRDAMPSYWLYGAVCFFGFHIRQGTATDLTADQRTLLQRMCTTSIPSSTERDSRV
ncbi:hypothetical protein, partial [Streptomyces capuensis]|uniref:hypothetical protein n=1 Tax=Streptomyces capuensis TaxID=1464056 RepID=UPI000519B635